MVAFEVRLEIGSASIHLVKVLMATRRFGNPPEARLKGTRASSPQVENGQTTKIVWSE